MQEYKKYNKAIVWKYNNGYDIPGYDVNELEKDKDFIIQAMDAANDTNLYNLLSDEAKNDPEVVLHIIRKFKEDRDFTLYVTANYVENTKLDINNEYLLEILIEMENNREKMSNKTIEDINPLEVGLKTILNTVHTMVIAAAKELEQEKDNGITEFGYIEAVYSENSIIKDYFAKSYVNELYNDYQALEKDLHHKYDKPDMIEKMGVNNFIVNILLNTDEYLGKYVSCSMGPIEDLRNNINKIIYNWEDYDYNRDMSICEYIEEYYRRELLEVEIPEKKMIIEYLADKLNRPGLVDCIIEEDDATDRYVQDSVESLYMDYDVDSIDDIMYEIKMKELYKNKEKNCNYEFEIDDDEFDYDRLSFGMKRKVDTLVKEVKQLYEQDYEDSYTIIDKPKNTKKAKVLAFKPKND